MEKIKVKIKQNKNCYRCPIYRDLVENINLCITCNESYKIGYLIQTHTGMFVDGKATVQIGNKFEIVNIEDLEVIDELQ